jgi:hypothetical protein
MQRIVIVHRFNGFGLSIYGGKLLTNGDVELISSQFYSIKLENYRNTVAECILMIDGKIADIYSYIYSDIYSYNFKCINFIT